MDCRLLRVSFRSRLLEFILEFIVGVLVDVIVCRDGVALACLPVLRCFYSRANVNAYSKRLG